LDNSFSVKRNEADILYTHIYEKIKNFDETLHDVDIYAYNFMVEKLAQADDIDFRGYSNVDSVIDYIEKNSIEEETIVLVTDDESFTLDTIENKKRNFASLMTNKFVVIKI
jgi:DNA-binding MurR/RpiR family transcriptional regulator